MRTADWCPPAPSPPSLPPFPPLSPASRPDGVVVLVMVLVRLASPDLWLEDLPHKCSRAKRMGCSRIAEESPHGARGLRPLHLPAALDAVQAQAEAWVRSQAQATLLRDTRPGFVHARVLSLFWGFPDDFMVGLRCVGGGVRGSHTGPCKRVAQMDAP